MTRTSKLERLSFLSTARCVRARTAVSTHCRNSTSPRGHIQKQRRFSQHHKERLCWTAYAVRRWLRNIGHPGGGLPGSWISSTIAASSHRCFFPSYVGENGRRDLKTPKPPKIIGPWHVASLPNSVVVHRAREVKFSCAITGAHLRSRSGCCKRFLAYLLKLYSPGIEWSEP